MLTLICANTLECARTRSKIVKTINTSSLSAQTGQTGYADRSDRFYRERRENLKPRAREGPVGARGSRVALRSAGYSEHPNAVETREEQQMGLEKLGFGGKN